MTLKKNTVAKHELKPVKFIFTKRGKKIVGHGVEGPYTDYEKRITTVTKENINFIKKVFDKKLKLKLTWTMVHGVQLVQNTGNLVWNIVYEGVTEAGDNIYYHRSESTSSGAGNSRLYANNLSFEVTVSSFKDFLYTRGVSMYNKGYVLDWLNDTGIASNVKSKRLIAQLEEQKKFAEAKIEFLKFFIRGKMQPNFDCIEHQLYLVSIDNTQHIGGKTFKINKDGLDFILPTIKELKPIQIAHDRISNESSYVLKNGAIIDIEKPYLLPADEYEVTLVDYFRHQDLKAETLKKIMNYYKKNDTRKI